MFVNCFTVTMVSRFYETILKGISNDFGKNIPRSLPFDGGTMGFITHLYCVDANVNVKEICKKYNCKIGSLSKIQIEENIYNNNYIVSYTNTKEGQKFYLEFRNSAF
jgi:hypothetical protein